MNLTCWASFLSVNVIELDFVIEPSHLGLHHPSEAVTNAVPCGDMARLCVIRSAAAPAACHVAQDLKQVPQPWPGFACRTSPAGGHNLTWGSLIVRAGYLITCGRCREVPGCTLFQPDEPNDTGSLGRLAYLPAVGPLRPRAHISSSQGSAANLEPRFFHHRIGAAARPEPSLRQASNAVPAPADSDQVQTKSIMVTSTFICLGNWSRECAGLPGQGECWTHPPEPYGMFRGWPSVA